VEHSVGFLNKQITQQIFVVVAVYTFNWEYVDKRRNVVGRKRTVAKWKFEIKNSRRYPKVVLNNLTIIKALLCKKRISFNVKAILDFFSKTLWKALVEKLLVLVEFLSDWVEWNSLQTGLGKIPLNLVWAEFRWIRVGWNLV